MSAAMTAKYIVNIHTSDHSLLAGLSDEKKLVRICNEIWDE